VVYATIFTRRLYGDASDQSREHLEEKTAELVADGMPRSEAAVCRNLSEEVRDRHWT
jgi:hypothetical protein